MCLPVRLSAIWRRRSRRVWPRRRWRQGRGSAGRSHVSADRDAPVQIITSKNAPRRCRSTATARRTCWPRRSRTCSPACSAASVRQPTKGSSTTSSCRGRSCPRTSRRSRRRCASSREQDLLFERQMWPREEAKRFFAQRGEPLKVQLIEEKTEGQTRGLLLHDQGQGDVRRLLRRPARAVHRQAEGVQAAHARRTRTGRATRATSRCSASTARRSSPRRSCRSTCTRLEEAKKRDHRKIGRDQKLFMFHQWAPGATFWLPKGTMLYNTLANYMRGVLIPAGYTEVKAPIVFNKALWETSGHWQHYRQNMFLVESEGEQMGLKAMNCPGHMLMFAQRGAQLPRSADPLSRADAAAPQRGVRRAVRADARPAVQPGRWPLLRDGVADRRRGRAACCGWCSASTATSG